MSRENTDDAVHRGSKHGGLGNASVSNASQGVSPRSQYHQTHNNPFNQTGASIGHQSSSTNTANIKGKIISIEEMIRSIQDDLQFHKQEVHLLKQEKTQLETSLTLQTQDVRKTLTNELFKVEEDIKRHFAQ